SLTMGERTGSRILFNLWPYVIVTENKDYSNINPLNCRALFYGIKPSLCTKDVA
ncbi:hypothetical protein BJ508DRAFT_217875, partial [Ascobolus immersus RN42]